jgi:hypothetical protein
VTWIAFGLFVVAVVVMVAVHYRMSKRLEATEQRLADRMDERLLERQKSMEKQGRALIREHERTRRKADALTRKSETLHSQIQTVLTDPKVQRVLNDG